MKMLSIGIFFFNVLFFLDNLYSQEISCFNEVGKVLLTKNKFKQLDSELLKFQNLSQMEGLLELKKISIANSGEVPMISILAYLDKSVTPGIIQKLNPEMKSLLLNKKLIGKINFFNNCLNCSGTIKRKGFPILKLFFKDYKISLQESVSLREINHLYNDIMSEIFYQGFKDSSWIYSKETLPYNYAQKRAQEAVERLSLYYSTLKKLENDTSDIADMRENSLQDNSYEIISMIWDALIQFIIPYKTMHFTPAPSQKQYAQFLEDPNFSKKIYQRYYKLYSAKSYQENTFRLMLIPLHIYALVMSLPELVNIKENIKEGIDDLRFAKKDMEEFKEFNDNWMTEQEKEDWRTFNGYKSIWETQNESINDYYIRLEKLEQNDYSEENEMEIEIVRNHINQISEKITFIYEEFNKLDLPEKYKLPEEKDQNMATPLRADPS